MRPLLTATLCLSLSACETEAPRETGFLGRDAPVEAIHPVCEVGSSWGLGTDDTGTPCPAPAGGLAYHLLGPNVMLAVDRSGSMQGARWTALQSLVPYLPAVGARANLGLTFFPAVGSGKGSCLTEGGTEVPITDGLAGADAISTLLTHTTPQGGTPIADTLDAVAQMPELHCPNRDNIAVLLTDGQESCDGDAVLAAEHVSDREIELFVIGFGTSAEANKELKRIARAARPSTGPDNFYTASTVEDLLYRLQVVTGSCTVQLVEPADAVQVAIDGVVLSECTEDRCDSGYRFSPEHRTVTLEGLDCLAVQDGACHDLQIE